MLLFKCEACRKEISHESQDKAFTVSMIGDGSMAVRVEKGMLYFGKHACSSRCLVEVIESYVL